MDVLQPLPREKWPLLRDLLKRDWPSNAGFYLWINTAIKWREKDPQMEVDIYCPDGKHDSGTFVGIESSSWYIVIPFAFEESQDILGKVLRETKRIDWTKNGFYRIIHENSVDIVVSAACEAMKIDKAKQSIITSHFLFKPKKDCAKLQFQIPEECELKHLDQSNIPYIHSLWYRRNIDHPEISTKYLSDIVRLNRGVGLFLKQDNTLVSWILQDDAGVLGMLQTLPEHQGKGYGKTVIKAMIKELALEEDID